MKSFLKISLALVFLISLLVGPNVLAANYSYKDLRCNETYSKSSKTYLSECKKGTSLKFYGEKKVYSKSTSKSKGVAYYKTSTKTAQADITCETKSNMTNCYVVEKGKVKGKSYTKKFYKKFYGNYFVVNNYIFK